MKTVALVFPMSQLANILATKGYQVIDWAEASRTRRHIDVILSTGHCPENIICCQETSVAADITVGAGTDMQDDLPHTIFLNITGMYPEEIIAALDSRLHHHRCHH